MILNFDKINAKVLGKKKSNTNITFLYQDRLYFYKRIKGKDRLYNELIAEKIARQLKIDCCSYHLAHYYGKDGVASEIFDRENFVTIESILEPIYGESSMELCDRNNLEDIWNAFYINFGEEITQKLMDDLVNIFLFDVLIGNIDRHNENYGLIVEKGNIRFAPLFDNEKMLDSYCSNNGDYSLGIEGGDVKDHMFFPTGKEKNLLYKFLDISDSAYQERLKNMLSVIEEENLIKILKEIEGEEEIIIDPSIKELLLEKFRRNRNMINRYFFEKEKNR